MNTKSEGAPGDATISHRMCKLGHVQNSCVKFGVLGIESRQNRPKV